MQATSLLHLTRGALCKALGKEGKEKKPARVHSLLGEKNPLEPGLRLLLIPCRSLGIPTRTMLLAQVPPLATSTPTRRRSPANTPSEPGTSTMRLRSLACRHRQDKPFLNRSSFITEWSGEGDGGEKPLHGGRAAAAAASLPPQSLQVRGISWQLAQSQGLSPLQWH